MKFNPKIIQETQINLAFDSFRKHQFQDAIERFKQIIEANSQLWTAIDGLGNIEDEKKQYGNNVIRWFFEAKQKNKIKATPYDALSLAINFTQNINSHLRWYQQMHKNQPKNYKLLFGIANIYYQNKQYNLSEQYYRKVIQLVPQWDKPYQQIANIYGYIYLDRPNAYTWAKKCLDYERDNYFARYIYASCTKEDYKKLDLMKQLVDKYPEYGRSYVGLANAYFDKNLNNECIQCYLKCMQINPHYDVAYYNLGYTYKSMNQLEKAIYWYKKCLEVNPQKQQAYCNLGNIQFNLKKYGDALKTYQKCLNLHPKNPLYLSTYANTLLILEQKEQEIFQLYTKSKFYMQNNQNKFLTLQNKNWVKEQIKDFFGEDEGTIQKQKFGYEPKKQKLNFIILKKQLRGKYYKIFKNKEKSYDI